VSYPIEETFHSADELIEWLNVTVPATYFGAHATVVGFNLNYDTKFYEKALDEKTMLRAGSRFITGNLANGFPMLDLWNHGGGASLDTWITNLNMNEKGIYKTEWRPDMTHEELVDHCRNDVKATWTFGMFLADFYQKLNVKFGFTTAGVAMDHYCRNMIPDWLVWKRQGTKMNEFERLAYYGGRTEVFKRGISYVDVYDLNSAYVAAMRDNKYPKPDTGFLVNSDRWFENRWRMNKMMIVKCRVTAPKRHIPILPWKHESGKLLFPYGTFNGTWCSNELRVALENGYILEKVYAYSCYNQTDYYFRDYAIWANDTRNHYKKTGEKAMEKVVKNLGNSLYGKMGEHHRRKEIYNDTDAYDIPNGSHVRSYHTESGDFVEVSEMEDIDSSHTFVCQAAFITANTRLILLKYLIDKNLTPIYCDTDSIYVVSGQKIECDDKKLGWMKLEDKEKLYFFIRPKTYFPVTEHLTGKIPEGYHFEKIVGRFEQVATEGCKAKGVKKDVKDVLFDYEAGCIHVVYRRPMTNIEADRADLKHGTWKNVDLTISLEDDKRDWKDDNESDPLYVYEEEL
jgi:hypothetical protein